MTDNKRFAINAAANYGRFLIVMATQFLLTPVLLQRVGARDFGLWSLTFSVMGFLGLLDGGLATSTVKFVASSKGDPQKRNRLLGTLLGLCLALSGVAVVATVILTPLYVPLFHIAADQATAARALLWLLALRAVILALPLGLFQGVLFGEQKIYLINAVQSVTTLLYAGGTALALARGAGIVTVGWLNLISMLAEYSTYMVLAYRTLPGLNLRPHLDRTLVKEVAGFSGAQFLVNVASLVRMRMDPILVQLFLSLQAVAAYSVALRIAESALLLTKQVINVFVPLVAARHAAGDEAGVRSVLLAGGKYVFAAATLLTVAICTLANEIITLWVGPGMQEAVATLIILMLSMGLVVPQMVAASVLVMTGHHGFSARAQSVGMVINVAVSTLLAKPLGLAGIAGGTLVATVLVDVAWVLPYACRVQGVPFASYFRAVFVPVLVCGTVQAAATLGAKALLPAPSSLLGVLPFATVGAIAFLAAFWLAFVNTSDRAKVLDKLRRRRR